MKKNAAHYGGFVSCFGFPCFTTLHFSTILFGPKSLSYLCTLLFYLCTKNTIVSRIVYTPKFVTTKENPKQASLSTHLEAKSGLVVHLFSLPVFSQLLLKCQGVSHHICYYFSKCFYYVLSLCPLFMQYIYNCLVCLLFFVAMSCNFFANTKTHVICIFYCFSSMFSLLAIYNCLV